jgi:hypothetical protein
VQVFQTAPASKVRLSLHPSSNPAGKDAVATPAALVITGPALTPINSPVNSPAAASPTPTPTPTTSITTPDPELRAYTAIELAWPSENNRLYQVQWTPSLVSAQWVNLGPAVSGSGADLSVFDSTRSHPQGFYRVRIVE